MSDEHKNPYKPLLVCSRYFQKLSLYSLQSRCSRWLISMCISVVIKSNAVRASSVFFAEYSSKQKVIAFTFFY